jgi:hypothetical protein
LTNAKSEYKNDLRKWLLEAIQSYGGNASIVDVCKYVWANYENELRKHGDKFFTWQYDIRWVADDLRREGILSGELRPRGIWKLAENRR